MDGFENSLGINILKDNAARGTQVGKGVGHSHTSTQAYSIPASGNSPTRGTGGGNTNSGSSSSIAILPPGGGLVTTGIATEKTVGESASSTTVVKTVDEKVVVADVPANTVPTTSDTDNIATGARGSEESVQKETLLPPSTDAKVSGPAGEGSAAPGTNVDKQQAQADENGTATST